MREEPLVRAPFRVVDDFCPKDFADDLRETIERHFSSPFANTPGKHMIWDYWFAPGQYTYLRSRPEAVLGPENSRRFHDLLVDWARGALGLGKATWPTLGLYVHGCRQEVHNDSANGRYGFVYSLTKNDRTTRGGATLLWREAEHSGAAFHNPMGAENFYDVLEPRFNRLIVFDDRLPHAVQMVEGVMDPLEGRIVLHGHIHEDALRCEGTLGESCVQEPIERCLDGYSEALGRDEPLFHGVLVLSLMVSAAGAVSRVEPILDRVKRLAGGGRDPRDCVAALVGRIEAIRFPQSAGVTRIILPIDFGRRFAPSR